MSSPLPLQDKVAIVTGASSGLGEAIAIMFASRGAKVTLCGRDEARLKSVYDQAMQVNGGHQDGLLMVIGDVNDQNVRIKMVAKTVETFGKLDILIPNAGVAAPFCEIRNATEESYDKIMNTNVKAVFFLIQQAVPHLEKTKGSIVTISSMLSTLVSTPSVIYPMSKAAIDHLTRCLALDLGPKGIRVNTINPSFIRTRILREFRCDALQKADEWAAEEKRLQPLEGRIGKPEDVAEYVSFLVSDAASFITGQNIKVDGGRCFTGPYGQPQNVTD